MTRQKSFKRLVRARMEKTGESYTAARARAARRRRAEGRRRAPRSTCRTAVIRERTGRGWEEWFDVLDAWGAADRPQPRSRAGWPRSTARPLGAPRR